MSILKNVDPSWFPILSESRQGKLQELNTRILPNISYQPRAQDIFNVFTHPLDKVKVVILGQDPYPTPENATGYAFAVPKNRKTPKSLEIIQREIKLSDPLNVNEQIDINLWPEQGIFLLNTALTVETGKAGSHLKYWEAFTKKVIMFLSEQNPCIWLLWGKHAKKFAPYIQGWQHSVDKYDRESIEEIPLNGDWNYILTAAHPVAEAYGSGGFYSKDHFYFVNRMLALQGKKTIIW